jgi:putative transposase
MARLPRLIVAECPMHLMVSGHNRQQIFFDDLDRRSYLEFLRDAAREYELLIHAYVLMPNHVHVLATPKHVSSSAKTMQSVGRRYAQLFNQKYQRTGTIWEGRYRSCILESQPYFLEVQQFIEQNPVRTHLVQNLEDYAWSSYRHHVGAETIPWISDHPLYWGLGNTPFERQLAWKKISHDYLSTIHSKKVSDHLIYGWPLGTEGFLNGIASKVARPVRQRSPGRKPNKIPKI